MHTEVFVEKGMQEGEGFFFGDFTALGCGNGRELGGWWCCGDRGVWRCGCRAHLDGSRYGYEITSRQRVLEVMLAFGRD